MSPERKPVSEPKLIAQHTGGTIGKATTISVPDNTEDEVDTAEFEEMLVGGLRSTAGIGFDWFGRIL